MKKSLKVWRFVAVLVIVTVASGFAAMASADITSESDVKSSSTTVYVPDNYTKIQQAVNAVNGEATIIVREVNKSLPIKSKKDSNKTIVQDRCNTSRETVDLNRRNWSYEPTNTEDEIPSSWNHEVEVPGLVDLAQPKVNWENYDYHWYKRNFTLNASQQHDCAFIKIGQSMFGTEVWLNGVHVGNDTSCFTSQEYDVSTVIDYSGENTLVVRVGSFNSLPENERIFTKDGEKESWIPGIWGDVYLILTGSTRIKWVQMIPHLNLTHLNKSFAEARVTLENLENQSKNVNLSLQIIEKKSGAAASNEIYNQSTLNANENKTIIMNISMPNMTNDTMWCPDNPFLYKLVSKVIVNGTEVDKVDTTFGMREFKIDDANFTLNGKRVYLRGSNIAFHRFLSDPERGNLPWNETWIKRVLCDIPKEHNFNYFRIHIGHAYNRWYDVADECGIMLQDEWMFWWEPSGSEEQIKKEFAQWLRDNWNHPSIVIWDCINEPWYFMYESCDPPINGTVEYNVTQEMKKLDPTRPWEPVDFLERHPYIYSLNPVLGKKGMLDWIKCKDKPNVNNEDIWFWLDKNGNSTFLTNIDILNRWLGQEETTPHERLKHQAFLGSEVTEFWRRERWDGIAPFVYLGSNTGATANWFLDIRNLTVKPIMGSLKNAFAPFGVSIELWDRHFFAKETRNINVYVFNDNRTINKSGTLHYKIINKNGTEVFSWPPIHVDVPAGGMEIIPLNWTMPSSNGTYYLNASLIENGTVVGSSQKIVHVFNTTIPDNLLEAKIMVYDPDDEIYNYLNRTLPKVSKFNSSELMKQDILILGERALLDSNYSSRMAEITKFVQNGHSVLIMEPGYGLPNEDGYETGLRVLDNLSVLVIGKEKGNYESYVFWEDRNFSVWNGINKEHLKMFNGGLGGEMVDSSKDVIPLQKIVKHAKCGKDLKIPALMETSYCNGTVVFSRIQVRGRLAEEADPGAKLYLRKANVEDAIASSIEGPEYSPDNAIDCNPSTRWSSNFSDPNFSDPQWIILNLSEEQEINKVILRWEWAYGKSYNISVSTDCENWQEVYSTTKGDGGVDEITFNPVPARYVRMYGTERGTGCGYSLWEFEVYYPDKLYSRRMDPVAQQYLLNLLSTYLNKKPVTSLYPQAVASSVEAPGLEPDNAVDCDPDTRWSSEWSDPQWIIANLGSIQPVNKVILEWETAYGKEYEVLVSIDGVNWTEVNYTNNSSGGIDKIFFNTVNARYVRMKGLKRGESPCGGKWGYSLWEFETNNSSEVLPIIDANASSLESSGLEPENVFDGDIKTRWSSNHTDNEWIYVDLGEERIFNTVELVWEYAYGKAYEIQISNDTINWTTVYNTTSGDGGTDTIFVGCNSARYVKMNGTERPELPWGKSGYSLYEFKVFNKTIRVTNVTVSGRQILVNGEPFTIRGVCYGVTPICEEPKDWFTYNYRSIYTRDLPLLRDMNCNAIRLWDIDSRNHTDFLDEAYNNGVKPIYVIAGYWIDPGKNLSDQCVREEIKNGFRNMVRAHTDHNAILMWCVGNEINMFDVNLSDWYSLLNECAQIAHEIEGENFHPVTTANWDITHISHYDASVKNLDVWGANVYRGSSFCDLFTNYANISTKPFWISEYGIDAFDNRYGEEYENENGTPYQAIYAGKLWDEMEASSVCSGGTIMAYSDEWWKAGDPCTHDNGGYKTWAHPDGYSNEEWWGIMRTVDNGSGPDIMQPRKVYYTLKNKWGVVLPIDTGPGTYPSIFGTHNGTIKPNQTITVSMLYTYPCTGTGGHTEYARIWNTTLDVNATWNGYVGDWHNISFNETFTLYKNKTYKYTIITGSYPQIHHKDALLTTNGWINSTEFTDANGKKYDEWIPAVRLW